MIGNTRLDGGHDRIKGMVDLGELSIPHAVSMLTPERFEALARELPGPNPNFLHIRNPQRELDIFVAIGEGAHRNGLRLERARRYRPDYIGAMLCGIWSHHYNEGQPAFKRQRVTTLFPAADWHAVDTLREAVSGNWTIQVLNGPKLQFSVRRSDVVAIPEPLGGFYNVILDEHGAQRAAWVSNGYNPVLIDIGAGTLQVVEMGAGYQLLDPDRIGKSYPLGVNQAVDNFILGLYRLGVIEDTSDVDRLLYRYMIQKGMWTGRGSGATIAAINAMMRDILNQLMDDFARHLSAHSLLAHSHVFLTGGGSALLARPILSLLEPDETLPSEDRALDQWAIDRSIWFTDYFDSIQFANIRGASKMGG